MPEPCIQYDSVSAQGVIDALNQARQRALDDSNHVSLIVRGRLPLQFEQINQQNAVASRYMEGPAMGQSFAKQT